MGMDNSETIQTDVVVVGYGGAGATAAVIAHDNGAKVIILEKMPAGGGNTRLSGGMLFTPTSLEAVKHVEILCFGKTSRDILEVYVEGCLKNNDWIQKMGGETRVHEPTTILYPPWKAPCWPNVPGVEHTGKLYIVAGETDVDRPAESLWRLLSNNVESRGIEVMTNTPAKRLLTNQKGDVVGVVAERKGKEISIKAKRAVILTCGSFDFNEAMKDTFLPLTPIYSHGSPGNTGDGIIMAQQVGAALWHMSLFHGSLTFKAPEYKAAFQLRLPAPNFIYVDKDGRRFTDETGWEGHEASKAFLTFMPNRPNYPHLPAYIIFDEVVRRKGPLYGSIISMGANRDYKWSLDNSEEIAKGWINRGKTIGDLARCISVDEVILGNTIAKYNEYCKVGIDADFNRSKENLCPIEVAPYYAIEIWPGGLTFGGPRRDKEARVLNSEGKPIPRLYSAGSLGSIWGFLALTGSMLTDCLVFGRIAGRNAAAEEPWL